MASEKITALIEEVKGLTVLELSELVHALEEEFGVSAAAMAAPAAAIVAARIRVIELLSGADVQNRNRASNMLRGSFYVCPVCGNAVRSVGEAVVSCCGITLPPLVPEEPDAAHGIRIETIEDELYVTVDHPMTKDHYISFLVAVSDRGMQFVKLYPEERAEAYFRRPSVRYVYAYCNRHGLFRVKR